jgi:hypothetical protein
MGEGNVIRAIRGEKVGTLLSSKPARHINPRRDS